MTDRRTLDDDLIWEAVDLLSDDGENLEYDRAIGELIARTWGCSDDETTAVHALLASLKVLGIRP